MQTRKEDFERWIDIAKNRKSTHIVVVCDTFGYEDYPVYVKVGEDVKAVASKYNNKNMQRVMEIIDMSKI